MFRPCSCFRPIMRIYIYIFVYIFGRVLHNILSTELKKYILVYRLLYSVAKENANIRIVIIIIIAPRRKVKLIFFFYFFFLLLFYIQVCFYSLRIMNLFPSICIYKDSGGMCIYKSRQFFRQKKKKLKGNKRYYYV